jgi:hypothetical protein
MHPAPVLGIEPIMAYEALLATLIDTWCFTPLKDRLLVWTKPGGRDSCGVEAGWLVTLNKQR